MNKTGTKLHKARRIGVMTIAASMVLQTVTPAYAVVSQLPGLFTTPPDANVMFTLDDSGSMRSDALPDLYLATAPALPNDGESRFANSGPLFPIYPDMWGSNSAYLSITLYRSDNAIARYLRSAAGNPLYYDPTVQYQPWPQAGNNNARMNPADPAAVNVHTDDPTNTGYRLNLNTRQGAAGTEANGYWRATYYVYKGTTPLPYGDPNHALNVATNFDKYEIPNTGTVNFPKAATRLDCVTTPGVCTRVEELQNFANWLQYYRNRRLMAKGGIGEAFAKLGTNLRAGFARIGGSPVVRRGMRAFGGTPRTDFFNYVYNEPSANLFTPLRFAMDEVGKHFMTTDSSSPWAETPGTATGTVHSCRRNFHFLSTDGFWNSTAASAPANADNDNFSGATPAKPDGTTFNYSNAPASNFGINPFRDTNGSTLADVAAYYWKTDLRSATLGTPALANDVPTSARDPAYWQHLSTFTIGLGIEGTNTVSNAPFSTTSPAIDFASTTIVPNIPAIAVGHPLFAYKDQPWLANQAVRDWLVTNKVPLNWTAPAADNAATGDDLIHASMNGRGKYFSASNPTSLATGLAAALAEATDDPRSLANVVTSSPQVSSNTTPTAIYQATYNPNQWSGRFYSFLQSVNGTVDTTPATAVWEASNKMPAPANRNIYTWNPVTSAGSTFTWTGLTGVQQGNLNNDINILNYLRGDGVNEVANGGTLRDRVRYTVGAVQGGVLGDIVNGSPIKGPSAGGGYERLPTSSPGQANYTTYRAAGNTALDAMRDTMFLGANDGMLHAFNRLDGVERFAFVPNAVYSVPRSLTGTEPKLKMLSDPAYSHRYTVDGPPQIGDAFIGASGAETWKTVLVSSTGAGARSVFALDVSNPVVGASGFGASKLLWEFSEANNADMGYVISYPHVARMRDGTWVAIFGNGYDSLNGQAKLFILNLQTGAVLWQQSVGAAGGNGLSQPNFTVNNEREVTAIYAGDLRGNLWKFDVDNADPNQWKVAFGGAPDYTPLFAGSANQPVTVMPEITFHPNGGVLVSMGTGKLFEVEDTASALPPNVNLNTQAIFGIWDKPGELTGITGTTTLVQQSINTSLAAASDASLSGTTSLTVDWATKRGWYLNLAGGGGERVNVNPQQAKSALLVVANTPIASDPCANGGTSRLFSLDPLTGGAPNFGVFDANGSGTITSADKGYNVKAIAVTVLSLPTLQTKKQLTEQIVTERVGTRGQTGERLGGVENKPAGTPTDCAQWLLAGGLKGVEGFDIALCSAGKPRISWRQLK